MMTVNPRMAEAMEGESGTGLPASIEAAWGLRERRTKGPRPSLTLDRIVDAAIHVAVTDGLAAVSMSRVAAELGAATMSLYRYVSAKDELLTLMLDAGYGHPPAGPDPDHGWRAGMESWAWAILHRLREHPWILRVPITAPPSTPRQLEWMEYALVALRDTGLGPGEKLAVMVLVSGYVRSQATLTADVSNASQAANITEDEVMAAYGQLMRKLADPARFPALAEVVASGVLDTADGPDDDFVFGLDRVLDGVDALVRVRTGDARSLNG
jgi:AcrR family transcriptional regulator